MVARCLPVVVLVVLLVAPPASAARWRAVKAVTPAGESAREAQLAITPDFGTLAVWRHDAAGHDALSAAFAPRAGRFGRAERGVDGATGLERFGFGIDAAGRGTVVWSSAGAVRAATREPGARFGPPQEIAGAPAGAEISTVSTAKWGGAAVVTRPRDGSGHVAWRPGNYNLREPLPSFRPFERVPASGPVVEAVGGMDQDSRVLVVSVVDAGPAGRHVEAVWRDRDGSWAEPQRLSEPGADVRLPKVFVTLYGNVVVAWQTVSEGRHGVAAAIGDPFYFGGRFSPPATLATSGAENVRVEFDYQGEGTVVWSEWRGRFARLRATTLSQTVGPGVRFTPPETISPRSRWHIRPEIASDLHGDEVVVWIRRVDRRAARVEAAVRLGRQGDEAPAWERARPLTPTTPLHSPAAPVGDAGVDGGPWRVAVAWWTTARGQVLSRRFGTP